MKRMIRRKTKEAYFQLIATGCVLSAFVGLAHFI
jgi:hypothetical protein